jgi:hypothetical protein
MATPHQLGNKFGFVASREKERWFNAGIAAGNAFTYAEAGFLVHWGRRLKAEWGHEMIRPGLAAWLLSWTD